MSIKPDVAHMGMARKVMVYIVMAIIADTVNGLYSYGLYSDGPCSCDPPL